MKSVIIILLINILFFISANILAQEKKYLLNTRGELIPASVVEKYVKPQYNDNLKSNVFGDILFDPNDIEDTLSYRAFMDPSPGFNFGFFGQDRMIQWFVAPADMRIVAAGVMCVHKDSADTQVELKLVNFAWTMDEISAIGTATNLGYYEAAGNGYNDITAYLDDPDRTGDWVDVTGNGLTSPFGSDLWSDGGVGYQFTPVVDVNAENYNWVQMNNFFEPEVLAGDIIGVSIKNLHPVMDEERIGWFAGSQTGLPLAFKFYQNGRLVPPPDPDSDEGWWMRDFTWDFALAVVLTSGPAGPTIVSFTQLGITLSTEPRLVEAYIIDQMPGGNPGVEEALILYSTDGGLNWIEIEMDGIEPNYYGYIPGMPPGTEVTYKIKATNHNGGTSSTIPVVYNIFAPENPNLVVFNGYDSESGYPQDYYFGEDVQTGTTTFPHDVWSYGALQEELVEFYYNIFEFCTTGPEDYNDSVITNWLALDGSRNYFLAGQEWLGLRYGFADKDFSAGDFEYDVLGITHSYNDVSFDGSYGSVRIPSLLLPVTGRMFGDPLLDLFNTLDPPADSMMYNPVFEIEIDNWIDAFEVETDVEVDMNVETRGIGGVPNVQILPTLSHRTLPAGNKIVFAAFDPLSINTAVNKNYPYYNWIGFENENTPYQTLSWFDIPVGVEEENEKKTIPAEFSLYQNYPNPFNPGTSIQYTVSSRQFVSLKVYDILGREIKTLVNEEKPPGVYEVKFSGSNLASGVYIYQLKAGEFVDSKKLILLR